MGKCNDSKFDLHHISGRGIIQIDPNCTLKTASYIIQAHKAKRITAYKIITPTIGSSLLTKEDVKNLSIIKQLKLASLDPIIIHDRTQLNELARDARLLSYKADQKLTLEKVNYDNSFNSIFPGILWRIYLLSCLTGYS